MKNIKNYIKLDWIDALFLSAGYVLWITIGIFLTDTYGVPPERLESYHRIGILLFLVVPFTLRRVIFGPPTLTEAKDGFLWSLLSIFGLFCTIGGMACLAFAASWLSTSSKEAKHPPNFLQQSKDFHARLMDPSKLFPNVKRPSETNEQFNQRLQQEKQERIAKRKKEIQQYAAKQEKEWKASHQSMRKRGWNAFFLGILLAAAGAFLIRSRYKKPTS